MNWLAANAEMEVRGNRYRIGNEREELVSIVNNNFFIVLEEKARIQVESRKRMMERFKSKGE